MTDISITQHAIPTDNLREWLQQIEAAIDPHVPFNRDNTKMLADAYAVRGHVLHYLANQLRARGVKLQ